MKKRMISILLASWCMAVVPVSAEEIPTVEFDGTTELKYSADETNFGTSFEGMVPSEERVQSIRLKNTDKNTVEFYMSTEVIEAFEEAKDATQAGYIVSLSVVKDGVETQIYGNKDNVNVGANEEGLYDLNGSLKQNYMVARLNPNEEAIVKLSVKLDGQSMKNAYQGLPGTFQFDFSVQYDDSEPETVVNKIVNEIKGSTQTIIKKVETGDPTTIGTLVFVMFVAGGVLLYLRKGGRKYEK